MAGARRENSINDWNIVPLRELIGHIVSTHHEYLKLELPRVGQRLRKVVQAHGPKDPATLDELQAVYQGLWEELHMHTHMHKEELMLFPAIGRYEAAVESRMPPAPSVLRQHCKSDRRLHNPFYTLVDAGFRSPSLCL